jgi:alkylation response protein AidB-like acyl-CoA dehydrogenase
MMRLTEEDQNLLRASAAALLQSEAPVAALRSLRENRPPRGFDDRLWLKMAEQGWLGVLVDEENGGLGLGFGGATILCQAMGRQLAASPFVSTSIMATMALQGGPVDRNRRGWLERIVAGQAIVALAVEEGGRHQPDSVTLSETLTDRGWVLSGTKSFVPDGLGADAYLVTARQGDEVLMLLVDAKAQNLTIEKLEIVDSRGAAGLHFDRVVAAETVSIRGGAILAQTLDAGRLGLAAELLGISEEVFSRTVDYLKQRRQFGHSLASYQALQHRAGVLYCEIEVLRSVVYAAARAADEDLLAAGDMVSAAKAKAIQVARQAVSEAVQLHGGIGMTDELDIGLFMKRVRVAAETLGNEYFHLDRFALLEGF